MAEYALILGLIIIVCVGVFTTLGLSIRDALYLDEEELNGIFNHT